MQKSYGEKGRENSYSAAISCRWVFLFMKVRRSQTSISLALDLRNFLDMRKTYILFRLA
jgi:hypothetical protein